jgi:hypothetical protein
VNGLIVMTQLAHKQIIEWIFFNETAGASLIVCPSGKLTLIRSRMDRNANTIAFSVSGSPGSASGTEWSSPHLI